MTFSKREMNMIESVSDDFIGICCTEIIKSLKNSECSHCVTIAIAPDKESAVISFRQGKKEAAIKFLLKYCDEPLLSTRYIRDALLNKASIGLVIDSKHAVACYKYIFSYFENKASELNLLAAKNDVADKLTLAFSRTKSPKNW